MIQTHHTPTLDKEPYNTTPDAIFKRGTGSYIIAYSINYYNTYFIKIFYINSYLLLLQNLRKADL